MGSDAKQNYGAIGRSDLLYFDPDDLVLVTDKSHPLYDERVSLPLDESMVKNIMVKGVIEPVTVRKNGEADGKPIVEIVFGRQRVKNAREANRRLTAEGKQPIRVPGVFKRGDDGDLFGLMISENEIRKDDSPVNRAKKIQRYLDMGRSVEDAAVTFGLEVQSVKNILGILDCADDVQKAMEQGQVPASAAKEFAKMPRERQEETLKTMVANGVTRGAAAVATLKAVNNGKKPSASLFKEKRSKMRSRDFVLSLKNIAKNEGRGEMAALLGYLLGDNKALDNDRYASVKELVDRAKGKVKK